MLDCNIGRRTESREQDTRTRCSSGKRGNLSSSAGWRRKGEGDGFSLSYVVARIYGIVRLMINSWKFCRLLGKPAVGTSRSPAAHVSYRPLQYRVYSARPPGRIATGTVPYCRRLLSSPTAGRPRQCPCSTGCSTPSRRCVRQQQLDVSMSSCHASCSLSPGRTRGGTRGWRLGMPLRSRVVGLPRTLPSASAWCARVLVQRVQRDARLLLLGVDSPAASSPGVLGASFSAYSGGRQRFVVDAGGWEVERVQMPGTGGATLMTTSPPPSSTSSLSRWDFRHHGAAWHLQHGCSGRGLGRGW